MPEPCRECNETGLVDGGFKIRKTCPKCHGFRVTKHLSSGCPMCSKEPKPELEVTRA